MIGEPRYPNMARRRGVILKRVSDIQQNQPSRGRQFLVSQKVFAIR